MLEVVGAVIVKSGTIMSAQRPLNKSLGGYWEFPGGKIELGESPEEALKREIEEELGCDITVEEFITRDIYSYAFGDVALSTYYCSLVDREPEAKEHQELRWLRIDELESVKWAPADLPTLEIIKKNRRIYG